MKDRLSELPNELVVMEILTWLPGKQVALCKCVCKSWRSMIRSPPFLDIYRNRQRGLILYWLEDSVSTCRLHFFHSPLRQISEPTQEFSPLHGLEIGSSHAIIQVTQMVDGILCVGELGVSDSHFRLTIHNVCNGEKMRIPDPVPYMHTSSTIHLGYDPAHRVYKLLRMIFGRNETVGSHIMTLRASASESTWREVNVPFLPKSERFSEYRRSANDGLLCWFWSEQYILCFDVDREEFQLVEQPEDIKSRKFMFFRALTRFMGRLAIWVSLPKDDVNMTSHYVQEDDQGKEWSLGCVDLPEAIKETGQFVIASGNISSTGEMLLVNADPVVENKSIPVYSFGRHRLFDKTDEQLFVGKLPEKHPSLHFNRLDHSWEGSFRTSFGRLSCLLESNNLHLPLDDILRGHLRMLVLLDM